MNMEAMQAELEAFDGYEPEDLECLNAYDGRCKGAVEYRTPLSGTGKAFPRCDKHWSERLDHEEALRERYPEHAPADFDPLYAGEAWGEEDY